MKKFLKTSIILLFLFLSMCEIVNIVFFMCGKDFPLILWGILPIIAVSVSAVASIFEYLVENLYE